MQPFCYAKTRILFLLALIVGALSCKKDVVDSPQPAPPTVDVKLTDSAAYTLDGITFTCNSTYGDSWSNRGANLDTSNGVWKWDVDTVQYVRTYSLGTSSSFTGNRRGNIEVSFVQKFARKDLRESSYQFFTPASDTVLFAPRGSRPYMMDYNRFNTENGVAISVVVGTIGVVPVSWPSYSVADSPRFPPLLPANIQKDSKFEITNLYTVPAGNGYKERRMLEARFSCLLFERDGTPHRLENGFVRVHVN